MVKNLFKPKDSNNVRIHSKYFTVLFSLILHIQLALALFRRSEQNTYILVTNPSFACMTVREQCQTVFCATVCLSLFSFKQYIIKQLLDSIFVISRIIKVWVSVTRIGLQSSDTLTLSSSRYHKNFIQ